MVSLLKLGGSVITFKDKPLEFNSTAVEAISSALSRYIQEDGEPLIVVHGGGSYGHYYSVKYDMHSRLDRYNIEGIAYVRCSMVELNNLMVKTMLRHGLRPFTAHPSSFVRDKDTVDIEYAMRLKSMAEQGLIPVIHGDVMHHKKDLYYILSGDEIMSMLAGHLKPRRVVFALSVDGVYKDMISKELIRELRYMDDADMSSVTMDVTGGMKRKVREALKIARMGMDVCFVNGLHTDRVIDALKGYEVVGTIVRGR